MRSTSPLEPPAVLLSVLIASSVAACHIGNDGPEKFQSSIVEHATDVDAAGISLVSVEGINGSLAITGRPDVDRIYVDAAAYVRAATFDEAEAALANLDVKITAVDGALEIESVQPATFDGCDYWVDYSILMPSHLVLNAVAINGDISAVGMEGYLTLALTNGTVTAEAPLSPRALADLSVVNGEVWLGVPADISATVSAQVTNGSVELNGFDSSAFDSSGEGITGVLGGGDAEIRLQAINGQVTLSALR